VLGYRDADHAETSPDAPRLVITALACSLVGQQHPVTIVPGTRAAKLYGVPESVEDYYCNYGVNPDYVRQMEASGLRVSGVGVEGEVRIVEIPDHPFFLATLFLPQARSTPAVPHPLLAGFSAAVLDA
jgi:CTP synthase (UTP-ammonia lyase)